MPKKRKEGRHIYKLPPCPSYDVECMESWLTDMAKNGLILTENGFFAGIASFKQNKPQNFKYRLEAAQKSDDGWEYIAKRGDFYICRSSEPGAGELNTDPQVQAIALNYIRKQQFFEIFLACLWSIYAILQIRGNLLLTMIHCQTWFFLLVAFFLLWLFTNSLAEAIYLGKLRKKLQNGGILDHAKGWKKRMVLHYTKNTLPFVLIIAWLFILLNSRSASVLHKETKLEDYPGEPPFASMVNLAGDGEYSYHTTILGSMSNTVIEWEDWLAPYNMDWTESAEIKRTDGTVIEGRLQVDYHETLNSWIAKRLALEYCRHDKRGKTFEYLETPALDVDYAIAYIYDMSFPTIVIQDGNIVVHATFYHTSSNYKIELDEWAQLMADSIKN